MLEMILILSMSPLMSGADQSAQFKPCVWPNSCGRQEATVLEALPFSSRVEDGGSVVAQFKPCVWPNRCGGVQAETPVLAQFKPCVWPNSCGGREAGLIQI
ncbi:MAG: hypothetical protein A2X36_00815 [Elusimicrobia bacterium GWA2_69_24]|nr:MAG: hypothetical protein A2X36_00815 [Elusimicrobia bacterium GWA2_69_24]